MTESSDRCPGAQALLLAEHEGHLARCPRCRAARRLALDRTLRASRCLAIEPLLAARILGQLDPGQEQVLIEHLAACGSCRALAIDLDEHPIDDEALADFAELHEVEPANYARGPEIGRGGMGRVLRARDRRLGRDVALKELLDDRLRASFEDEARLTARLQHPSIVNILEAGRWPNGTSFYAMKHVAGRPLDRLISLARTLAERLALLPNLITVVDAVAYAHSARVIHRDLKPANILIGPFGETVVIDWGLARDLAREPEAIGGAVYREGDGAATAGGAGTPAYMPPEQAGAHIADERLDVYALGATLYHLLTGQPPYGHGRTAVETMALLAEGPPPAAAALAPEAPRALTAIVAKAMARDREARYPTARELADELKRFQSGQLVAAHSYTLTELLGRFVRRHAALVGLATASALVLAAVGALSVAKIAAARGRAEDQLAELLFERGRQELARAAPSRAFLYLADAMAHGRDTPALRSLLARASRPAEDLARVLPFRDGPQIAARLSPDGSRLAVAGYDGGVRLYAMPGGEAVATLRGHTIPATTLRFSPDGQLLLTAGACWIGPCDSAARVWDARTGEQRAVLPHPVILDADFEGNRVAVTGGLWGRLWWDLATGLPRAARPGGLVPAAAETGVAIDPADPTRALETGGKTPCSLPHGSPIALAGTSRDGRAAFTAGVDGTIRIWRLEGCAQIAAYDGMEGRPLDAALEAAGGVLTVVGEREARQWSVHGRLLGGWEGSGPIAGLAFDHAGQLIAHRESNAGARSDVLTATDVVVADVPVAMRADAERSIDRGGALLDGEGHVLARLEGRVLGFGAGGRRVIGLGDGGVVRIWDAADGALLRSFAVAARPTLAEGAVQLSPRGDLFTTMPDAQTVALWDAESGGRRATLAAGGAIEQVAFSADGTRLLTAGGDVGVTIWDRDGRRVADAEIGPGLATVAAWSHDGGRIVVGGRDRVARLCDSGSGAVLEVLGPFPRAVRAVAFSDDDRRLAVLSHLSVTVWDVDADRRRPPEIAAARARVAAALAGPAVLAPLPAGGRSPSTESERRADELAARAQDASLDGRSADAAALLGQAAAAAPSARRFHDCAVAFERLHRYRMAASYFRSSLALAGGEPHGKAVAVRAAALEGEADIVRATRDDWPE